MSFEEPEPDPYLCAVPWTCTGCGAKAYAIDASWLTEELVLATYSQPHRGQCPGPRAFVAVVNPLALVITRSGYMLFPPTRNARRAREYYRQHSCKACGALAQARYCGGCRCQDTTLRGRRCANRAGPAGTCGRHGRGDYADGVVIEITGKGGQARPRMPRKAVSDEH
jgi:hypothetical protein